MQRFLAGSLMAGLIAATAAVGAQGNPQPTNSPPRDTASPAGVQRAPTAPSAQTKAKDSVTLSGCLQDSPAAIAGRIEVPAAGPAAGTTGATPAEKAAERAGNVPDPHEGPAAAGKGSATVPGGDRTVAETRSGRATAGEATGRDAAATANVPALETSGHAVYFLNYAATTADGTASPNAVGTSGIASASYRLEGDSATLGPHLNRQVRIVGTLQGTTPQTVKVESVTKLTEKCDLAK
jgi:hypothetical protein